jgi:phosphatidylserine/phosphatidylglycerophosphate/cardiolipin synthase-like enzyme
MFRFLFKLTLHVAVVAIVIAVASQMGLFRYVHLPFDLPSVNFSALASPLLGSSASDTHYGPVENLERLDLAQLDTVSGHLDIAMYGFTDRAIATELIRMADAGIDIRIYRDGGEFRSEQERSNSTTDMFAGHPTIHIRVKPASRNNLMHLKAYSDGFILRDGSANWSPSGEKVQDNSLILSSDKAAVRSFERTFDDMWDRPANLVIQ